VILSVVLLCIAAGRSCGAIRPRKKDGTLGSSTSGAPYCKVIAGHLRTGVQCFACSLAWDVVLFSVHVVIDAV
jgi:hypothetical protein